MANVKKKGGAKSPIAKKSSVKRSNSRAQKRSIEEELTEAAWVEGWRQTLVDFEPYVYEKLGVRAGKKVKLGTDEFFRLLREWYAETNGIEVWDGSMSDHEYLQIVAGHLGAALIMAARYPVKIRDEIERYIKALNEIKKEFPQGTRSPGKDVDIALKYYDRKTKRISSVGYTQAIQQSHGEAFYAMPEKERNKIKKQLRKKVYALVKSREKRANEKKART